MLPITLPPYTAETEAAIARADEIFHQIVVRTPESLGTSDKDSLLMAFSSLVMEHFRAICILSRSQVATGSAFALFRPLVDTVVRGEWLYLCAAPHQLEQFMKRSFNLSSLGFPAMAAAVDAAAGVGRRMEDFTGRFYTQMCDYTHTGHDAVCHRLATDGGIEPTYPEEQVRILVTQAARVALLHFVIVYSVAGHDESVSRLLELFSLLDAKASLSERSDETAGSTKLAFVSPSRPGSQRNFFNIENARSDAFIPLPLEPVVYWLRLIALRP